MRAAGILLVATMLTTCMTAGTFAKYTTSDSATDTARVAKFGVTVAINGSLFGEEYRGPGAEPNEDPGNSPTVWTGIYDGTEGKGVGTVQVYTKGTGAAANNVVAPGTQNDTGMGFAVKGMPEVDCTVDIEVEAKNIYLKKGNYAVMQTIYFANEDDFAKAVANENIYKYDNGTWTKVAINADYDDTDRGIYCIIKDQVAENEFNSNDYYPVVYSVADSRAADTQSDMPRLFYTGAQTSDSLKNILTRLYAVRNGAYNTGVIAPNDEANKDGYTKVKFRTYTQEANRAFDTDFPQAVLTWKWDYENSNAAIMEKYDKFDTILGNLVAQDGGAGANISDGTFTKTPVKSTGPSDVQCTVVKAGTTAGTYVLPEAATLENADAASGNGHTIPAITNSKDYNLETAVYFKATVTQVD